MDSLQTLFDALPVAIYATDAAGVVTFANQAAVQMAGRPVEIGRDKWCVSWRLYSPDGRPMPLEECPMAQVLKEGRPVRGVEIVVERPDGTRATVRSHPTPMFNKAGKLVGAVNMLVDVTERKRAEAQRDLLVAELSHRVKNTLATVVSIARQSFAKNPNVDEARRSFDARILALAQTHTRLAEANWSGVLFETLLLDEFAPYRRQDGGNVRLAGPPIALSPRCVLTLGMAIHELATNAAKYGALSTKEGVVDVAWNIDAQTGALNIRWSESGGPPVAEPKRTGFGRQLLERAMAAGLKGAVELDFAPAGITCTIAIPASDNIMAAE